MTERFEVHESVTRVYLTGNQEPDPRRVAVPVEDVPGIVRAEVERALDVVANRAAIGPEEQRRHERFADAYLRERFGEGEPEKWSTKHEHQWTTLGGGNPAVLCGACGAFKDQAPSAPAVRIDGVLHDTNLRNTCVRCTWMPDGSLAGRCERCGQAEAVDRDREENPRYTPAERDFLRALAEERVNGMMWREADAAARRVVEEAKS